MTALEFLTERPDFFNEVHPLSPTWAVVSKQARRHSSRDCRSELFEKARPGEADEILEYRKDNDRLITQEGVDKFHSLTVRILKNSHIDLAGETIEEAVREFLNKKPFRINTQKLGLVEYFYTWVLRYSIDDANAVWFPFPVSRVTQGQAPIEDQDEAGAPMLNRRVSIVSKLVPSRDIILNDELFAFKGEMVDVEIGQKTEGGKVTHESKVIQEPAYYVADEKVWLQYYPIENPGDGPEIIYEIRPWYPHNSGKIPVVQLPGTLSYTEIEGENIPYLESILHSMFEYADEVVHRFSDLQGVTSKHAHPKIIMTEMVCPECGGHRTIKVGNDEKTGNAIMHTCSGCGGSGIMRAPGPFQTLYMKTGGKKGDLSGQGIDAFYKEVAPDMASITAFNDLIFKWWDIGKKSVGLDVLGQIGESGKAHEIRLEVVQDKLGDVAEQVCNSLESFLYLLQCLLIPDNRKEPKVTRPKSLSVKPAELLLKQAQESPECARFDAYMEYYQARFRNDQEKIRTYELAMRYSPLVCMDDAEIELRITNGSYQASDIVKADRAVWAFSQLTKEETFHDPESEKEMFAKADELIAPYIVEITPLVGISGEGIEGEQSGLVTGGGQR